MKNNAPKRKIFDAVDFLTEEAVEPVAMQKKGRMELRCLASTP